MAGFCLGGEVSELTEFSLHKNTHAHKKKHTTRATNAPDRGKDAELRNYPAQLLIFSSCNTKPTNN